MKVKQLRLPISEILIILAMNDYLESLVASVSFMMNSKGPEFSQLLLTNMTKPRKWLFKVIIKLGFPC